jgi:hypothetical protein
VFYILACSCWTSTLTALYYDSDPRSLFHLLCGLCLPSVLLLTLDDVL